MDEAAVSRLRKRRGVVRASITRLGTRVKELESKSVDHTTVDVAQRLKEKLETLDSEFSTHHYALIDAIDDVESLEEEQEVLDEHDDAVSLLTTLLQRIIKTCSTPQSVDTRKIQGRKLLHLDRDLSTMQDEIAALSTHPKDTCLIQQYADRLAEFKTELKGVHECFLSLDLEEHDELFTTYTKLDKLIFSCSLEIKKLLKGTDTVSSPSNFKGVKLPKLEVPSFDGNILNWTSFWEQFCVSVHNRPTLSDPEKLVYLQQALKAGSARHAIDGLSRSGENYKEAIDCLRERYDRPRLIHRTHVQMIVDTPPLKEGTGRELRRLHGKMQQHLRALKAMDREPSGPFITSVIELKLDATTMFEWQKHSQSSKDVPHCRELLEFINVRAQASETYTPDPSRKSVKSEIHNPKKTQHPGKSVASFTANTTASADCVVCKNDKHPLYVCPKFKSLPHDRMMTILRENKLCMNCLRPGHFVRQCKSLHHCRQCQKPHHTLLHVDSKETLSRVTQPSDDDSSSNAAVGLASGISPESHTGLVSPSLLMTCRILVDVPDSHPIEVRALLDCASSTSFITERLAQCLRLPRSPQKVNITGIAGLSHKSHNQSVTHFTVSTTRMSGKRFDVVALIVPRVTCDLPFHPISFDKSWKHLSDIPLADPTFGQPGKVDILLGVDIFTQVLLHGRRVGPPNAPVAFETEFGWVLAENISSCQPTTHVATCHALHNSSDDLIRKFWEVEESPTGKTSLSPEERFVVEHFETNHHRDPDGRFVVPLPKKPDMKPLGESRSQAVRRFLSLEKSLKHSHQTEAFHASMEEYFDCGHAEIVPSSDLDEPTSEVFYLPMHIVHKESSSTSKIRIVFDASAKSSTGVSLNDVLVVGPTVHPPLVDVLLRFRFYRVALVADVSRMYRAVSLPDSDQDLHRFVWRKSPDAPLQDYRMTRVTFGVSASSFAANMAVKQNAHDHALQFPLAAETVDKSFYVDDCLSGADSVNDAIELQSQLQGLFSEGGFLLRKWNSSEPVVLEHLPPELIDTQSTHSFSDPEVYTKTLGIQWNSSMDSFRLSVVEPPPLSSLTKRLLVSDIGKIYDVLGWFSPTTVKAKILLQRVWESRIDWDDPLPQPILDDWLQWRTELPLLSEKIIPRCYYPKMVHIASIQLHGFSDTSEAAYAGVVYLRLTDSNGRVHTSLVTSKTKVAPIKRLTLPRLELCGANLLARLLYHVKDSLNIPLQDVYAWTDSTIVLSWLDGNPRRFKTYVGNRISCTMELIPTKHWRHVSGLQNPADCASRGLFPSELLEHSLWWHGPEWLKLSSTEWPKLTLPSHTVSTDEEKEISLITSVVVPETSVLDVENYSSYTKLKRITAWIMRFAYNCRALKRNLNRKSSSLQVEELMSAERYWLLIAQQDHFSKEVKALKNKKVIPKSSCLLPLHPFVDSSMLLRVGGREQNSKASYASQHPIILHGNHPLTKLIVLSEHLRLLHAGAQLVTSMLSLSFHIIGHRKLIRSITRGCITCRRHAVKPKPQILGQLPMERVTPDAVFDRIGVDYAGPIYVKYGYVRKPTVVKTYVCVFVSLTVKAVHLELVSDLSTDAFIACLRRFISRRGIPGLIWSDHGSNFVGAARELKELSEFLELQKTQKEYLNFAPQ